VPILINSAIFVSPNRRPETFIYRSTLYRDPVSELAETTPKRNIKKPSHVFTYPYVFFLLDLKA